MAKQKGSDFLLKCDLAGNATFVTIAGIQNGRIRMGRDLTDVTNQGSTSKHREGLEGASIYQQSVSGDGVLDSGATLTALEALMRAGTIREWQVIVPGVGTYEGLYAITSLEFSGAHQREVTMTIALESAGVITHS